MIKTADLERSKRLDELGFKPETYFVWTPSDWDICGYSLRGLHTREAYPELNSTEDIKAPQAGEMIEWLLGHFFIHITDTHVEIADQRFSLKDGLCNALADSVIWVLERKGV